MVEKIEACVGVGIYSLKLTYRDGTTTPLIGSRLPNVDLRLQSPSTGEISETRHISMKAWAENYVLSLTFANEAGEETGKLDCAGKGTSKEF